MSTRAVEEYASSLKGKYRLLGVTFLDFREKL
jgi:hypothetical protein